MHPLFFLVFATLAILIAFLVWNLLSTRRHRFGQKKSGIGGVHDPLAGATDAVRRPDEMIASLEDAANKPAKDRTS